MGYVAYFTKKIYDVVREVWWIDYDKYGYVITQVHEISLDAAKIQYTVKLGIQPRSEPKKGKPLFFNLTNIVVPIIK